MMTRQEYGQLIGHLTELARAALLLFDLDGQSDVDLLSYSENAIFRISDPRRGTPAVLRVHRPHYHSRNAIRSELDWMAALREAGIHTPQSLPGRDGEHLQTVSTAALGERSVALFCWIPGDFPSEDELEPSMFRLGELSARMHAQSRVWQRPAYFERLSWDHAGTIGPKAHWGRWDRSPGLTMEHQAVLRDTEALLCARLDVFGRGPDRFGLIHADQRIANLLVDGDTTHIIDFDDCGLGWFLHDLGAALSFIEHRPDCDRLVGRWAEGYARIGTLSAAEVAEFPSFVMQRRLQLLAWRGSHHETDLARSLDQEWVSATARMGAEYLRSMG